SRCSGRSGRGPRARRPRTPARARPTAATSRPPGPRSSARRAPGHRSASPGSADRSAPRPAALHPAPRAERALAAALRRDDRAAPGAGEVVLEAGDPRLAQASGQGDAELVRGRVRERAVEALLEPAVPGDVV